jgi:hypothetical protein
VQRTLWLVVLVACGPSSKSPQAPTIPLSATISAESAEAAYDSKNWSECAAQWTTISGQVTGELKTGALYDAACCYALDGRVDAAIASLETALEAGYWDAEHAIADEDLAPVRAHAKWPALETRLKASFTAYEATLVDPALRKELLALAAQDQRARFAIKSADDKPAIEAVMAIDRAATARMKEVIAKHGWPGKKIVGVDGANAAWLLVQHADADPAFQKDCLAKMEPLVQTGEVSGKDYAYLFDRVAIADGRPQRYGTQFDGEDIAPLEDPAKVDERRKSVGLGTLAEYKAFVKKAEAALE